MKTAVFLPDELFQKAEKEAARLNISRSKLFAAALQTYLEPFFSDEITQTLNKIYSDTSSRLDSVTRELQFHSLPPEKW